MGYNALKRKLVTPVSLAYTAKRSTFVLIFVRLLVFEPGARAIRDGQTKGRAKHVMRPIRTARTISLRSGSE